VLLDNQLYLFDTQLGLPVPATGQRGIATLSQVIADPAILRNLDVGEKYKYPIQEADLQEVVAMLDTTPEYLSQRMKVLESNLTGEWQMVLTTSPTAISKKLESCAGLKETRLWAVPYETGMYRGSYQVLLEQDPEARQEEFARHGIFNLGLTELAKGRRKHLLGKFSSTDDSQGATEWYIASRLANASLDNLDSSEKARLELGIKRQKGMSQFQWENVLSREKEMRVMAKQDASYFLGLIHFEKGNYDVATNWFTTRTLDAYPDGPWTEGARYNLARCQEELGNLEEARRLYLTDESPQRHGSLIRARRLEASAPEPS
jgi:tetratricopeptide (TPR) repeat protein